MVKSIDCPVTIEQLLQIDTIVARTGQTRSEWLQSIVVSALSETPVNIRNLTDRVAALENAQADVLLLHHQVDILMQRMLPDLSPSLQYQLMQGPHSSQQPPSSQVDGCGLETDKAQTDLRNVDHSSKADASEASIDTSSFQTNHGMLDDQVDDEPDEVLYDFLEPNRSLLQGNQGTASPKSYSPQDFNPPDNIYDAEDEPDEILYDFLDESDRPF